MFQPIDPNEHGQIDQRTPFFRRKLIILIILASIAVITIITVILLINSPTSIDVPKDVNALQLHLLKNSVDAKCLDGSPFGVYYHPGYGEGKNKIVIDFWPLGWCHERTREAMLNSCAGRTNNYYGSSNYFASEYKYGYDFLGGEEAKNKYFFNWHRLDVPYCDGTGIQGQINDPIEFNGKKLFFHANQNMLAAIKFIFEKIKIEDVDIIVTSGCSSGGFAAFQWTQYLSDFVQQKNKNAVVMGITQGGFFIDYENLKTNDHDFLLKLKQMYSLVNKETPAINTECVKDHPEDPHLCLLPEKLLKYIKTPFLILQAAYDSWHIWDTLGEDCHEPGKTLTNCSKEKRAIITKMKNYTKNLLMEAGKSKSNLSVWSPACVFHCYESSLRDSKNFQVKGITINEVIGDFLNSRGEKQILLFDDVEWPDNRGCNNL